MQAIQLIHDNKLTEYLVNQDHNLILRIIDTAKDDNCDVQIHHTNYPELKVIINEDAPAIDDMDLELGLSEEYLMYRTEELMMSKSKSMQSHLCFLGLNSLQQMEHSPFHKDALIRTRGNILQELQCTQ